MNGKRFRFLGLTVWLLGCALVIALGTAAGQQAPPTENKGMKAPVVASLDLGPEIDGMQGRQLRMRVITLEPGGVIAVHPHKDRPSVVHLLQGTWTELREGGYVKEYREGDSWAEGKATTHWAENRGAKPAVAVVVDIFRQP